MFVPCDVPAVVTDIEGSITAPREAGRTLGDDVVKALDVLYHALVFTGHPQALEVWRIGVRDGSLADEGRSAVTAMLVYLNDAIERGESFRVSQICDCLEDIMGEGAVKPRVGGFPGSRAVTVGGPG